jgi:hypothetical protein
MGLLEAFPELKHLISIDAYHRMGETGVLPPDARVELIASPGCSSWLPVNARSCVSKGRCR